MRFKELYLEMRDNVLLIPEENIFMDVLVFDYKIKNGEVRIKPTILGDAWPNSVRVFFENDTVCLASSYFVLGIDKSSIRSVRRINKRISMPEWNKKEFPLNSKWKKYRLKINLAAQIILEWYFVIDIDKDGEQYRLYVPSYEEPVLKYLLHDVPCKREGFDA